MTDMEDHPKCRVTGCDGVGVTRYNGRCQTCYQQLSEVTVNKVSREPEGSKVRPGPVCWTLGCSNPGTSVSGLCPQCYLSEADSEGNMATFPECVATDCTESGYRKLQGFCRRCFSACQIIDRSVIRKPSGENNQQLCTTPNCEFYGLEEQNGQCSYCFKDFLDRKSKCLSGSFETTGKSLSNSHSDYPETPGKPVTNSSSDCSETARKSLHNYENTTAMNVEIKNSNYNKRRHTTTLLDYEPINSDELFGSGADEREHTSVASTEKSLSPPTEFTVRKQNCKQLCGRKCVAQCDPYCMTCWEALKLQPVEEQARLMQLPHSDVRPAGNPSSSKSSGREKPMSDLTPPLLRGSTSQGHGTKASPMSHDESQQGKNPVSQGQGKGDPPDCKRPEKKKIRLKFVSQDKTDFNKICTSSVIICLWSIDNINNGTHPLFEKIGEVINPSDLKDFKTCLHHDEVVLSSGGTSTAARVLHSKYHPVTRRQVASALLRCLEVVEATKETRTIFPVMLLDDLCNNLDVVISATIYAISNIQKSTSYSQNLDMFCLYVGNEGIVTQCKQMHQQILADKENRWHSHSRRQKCHTCKTNPSAILKPLSGSCEDECAVFCICCLKKGRYTGLDCPKHGPCFSPTGHKNTFALLVSGYDKRETVAKLFVADMQEMEKTLMDESVIGIRKENIRVIQTNTLAEKDDMKAKLMDAFKFFQERLRDTKDHARFYFYYSGHNSQTKVELGDRTNDITPKELKKELNKLHVESLVIILDCCYSAGVEIIPDKHEEDFMSLSSCSKDDSEPSSYIPRLWNLESSDDYGDKGDERKVYQWSSSTCEEKSLYSRKRGSSFFTLSIVKAMMGLCPLEEDACANCKEFKLEVRNQDGVFLEAIKTTVSYHVKKLADNISKSQNPMLDSNVDDDILLSFHKYVR
ncbi:uncharacterized protein [Haliotis asinina]|uniref:uncharacterized protein n=1 Tax=Haliotis asinina TaxID=109174 RepID=UPI0035320AD1